MRIYRGLQGCCRWQISHVDLTHDWDVHNVAEARLNSQFFRNLTTASDRQSQNQLRRPQHVTEVQRIQNVLIATG